MQFQLNNCAGSLLCSKQQRAESFLVVMLQTAESRNFSAFTFPKHTQTSPQIRCRSSLVVVKMVMDRAVSSFLNGENKRKQEKKKDGKGYR